jgi:aspartate/methionine/tyrosine aminotransferase
MGALRVIASEIWSTPTAPVQYAAVVAYGDDPEIAAYIDECARIHAARTQHLWSWMVEMGIPCAQPAGGFYMFPNFDRWRDALAARNVHTSEDLAGYLLDTYQIATLPGTAFGAPSADLSLRLATSYVDMETDASAEALLRAYRAEPDPAALLENHHPHLHNTIERLQQFVATL